MSIDLTRIALQTRRDLQQQSNIELSSTAVSPVYLTLTRTTTLSVGPAGAVVTWQSEDRNSGFTWSGSVITIPSDGYYLIDVVGYWNSVLNPSTFARILIGGVVIERMTNFYYANNNAFRVMAMRHFSQGDNVEIQLFNPATSTLTVIAYSVANNSPYLHIVKVA